MQHILLKMCQRAWMQSRILSKKKDEQGLESSRLVGTELRFLSTPYLLPASWRYLCSFSLPYNFGVGMSIGTLNWKPEVSYKCLNISILMKCCYRENAHVIIESYHKCGWKTTLRSSPTINLTPACPPVNDVPKHHIHVWYASRDGGPTTFLGRPF